MPTSTIVIIHFYNLTHVASKHPMAQPKLPDRFPCWCRATYSWGGETKRDLGFVEGDLIECLNAGDGAWWMGRLHRDRRAMGLFPSNFVKVLDDGFRPISRSVSPLVSSADGSQRVSGRDTSTSPRKSKTFRKPFQAYIETSGSCSNRNPGPSTSTSKIKGGFRKPFEAYSQTPSPNITPPPCLAEKQQHHISPLPSRQPSFVADNDFYPSTSYNSRASNLKSSGIPDPDIKRSHHEGNRSRDLVINTALSNNDSIQNDLLNSRFDNENDDSPPPPPPPHRVHLTALGRQGSVSSILSENVQTENESGRHTPIPLSAAALGNTPSPLRDAIDDVMSSLHHMTATSTVPCPAVETEGIQPISWSSQSSNDIWINPDCDDRGIEEDLISANSLQHLDQYLLGEQPTYSIRQPQETPNDELFLHRPTREDGHRAPVYAVTGGERPSSANGAVPAPPSHTESACKLRSRKSAYELGRGMLDRSFTSKSSATNSSSGVLSNTTNGTSSTQKTSQSIMSGYSAGGFSATSAGSLARKRAFGSIRKARRESVSINGEFEPGYGAPRPKTPSSRPDPSLGHHGRSYSVIDSRSLEPPTDSASLTGGLTMLKSKRSGFLRKLVESAKTGAANARGSLAAGQPQAPRSPIKNLLPSGVTAISGGKARNAGELASMQSGLDWMQVRRDVNRSNSLSRNERADRAERCQILGYPVIAPIDSLIQGTDGDEGHDGLPVQHPADFRSVNLQLVDKSTRFLSNTPSSISAAGLAQGYLCRPYRSDVQKLRAIFTWVGERVIWEDDFEGNIDTRRMLQIRRGCSEEIATLVMEMCHAVGIPAEIVRGYLKTPGEVLDSDCSKAPNHWWNAVIAEGEWRMIDCSLSNPTNPKRASYSKVGSQLADSGYFLVRPSEICYSHVPTIPEQQHLCPPIAPDILFALPCTCPSFFKNDLRMVAYDTSLSRIDGLELVQIQINVPPDIECFAETEVREFCRDVDGDVFESGSLVKIRALAQAGWINGERSYTIKGHLPGDEGHGVLNVYSGKRGLMHSVKDNPFPLSCSIPIVHSGANPPYQLFLRHPTPHAQRHDLYVVQPQCARLSMHSTFVFAVRQHPSRLPCSSPTECHTSGLMAMSRPSSSLSMVSSSALSSSNDYFSQCGSSTSDSSSSSQQQRPAKLAIQSPSGKIIRLVRKSGNHNDLADSTSGGLWETVIKISEIGNWRGLVLADRSARWCVFGEWECH